MKLIDRISIVIGGLIVLSTSIFAIYFLYEFIAGISTTTWYELLNAFCLCTFIIVVCRCVTDFVEYVFYWLENR